MSKDTPDLATQIVRVVGEMSPDMRAASLLSLMFTNSQRQPDGMNVHQADQLGDWGRLFSDLGAALTESADRYYNRPKP